MNKTNPNLLASILNVQDNLVILLNLKGEIIKFNKACEKITGYSLNEVKNKKIWNVLIKKDEIEETKKVFTKLKDKDFPVEHENYLKTKAGDLRLIFWSNNVLLDENDEVIDTNTSYQKKSTETVIEIRSGKKRTKEKNFFPGYILVKTRYDEEVNNLIQSAPSCLGFLKVGKSQVVPEPLKKHEVERIIGRVMDNQEAVEKGGIVDIPYKEGDIVKVVDGPFKEFDGTVQEVLAEKLKLRVMVSIFGRKTPVEVDLDQVESAT